MMFDVTAIGELLIDFTPAGLSEEGNELYERNPGGAPANLLAVLAKLGKKVAFMGMVGEDAFGKYLRETLVEAGIHSEGLLTTEVSNTTLAFVHLKKDGDRSFSFYRSPGADTLLEQNDVDLERMKASRLFHFGAVSLSKNPSRETNLYAATVAKNSGLIVSYDPNYRPLLWSNEQEAKIIMLQGLELADIVKLSEEELAILSGCLSVEEGTKFLAREYSIPMIFVTLGEKGCYYCINNMQGFVKGFKVKAIDTTGAGDAFFAGILNKMLENNMDIYIGDRGKIEDMIRFANALGALTTTKHGGIPSIPEYEEIMDLLNSYDDV